MSESQLQRLRIALGVLSGRITLSNMPPQHYDALGYGWTCPPWIHVQEKCERILLEHIVILDPEEREYT